jgi:hypothetical protein
VLNATESNSGSSTSTTVTVTPTVSAIGISTNPSELPGNGAATSTITTTVTGPSGSLQPGDTVTYAVADASTGTLGTCGTVIPPSGGAVTNASGQTTATYVAGTDAAVGGRTAGSFCAITATVTAGPGTTAPAATTQIDQLSIS